MSEVKNVSIHGQWSSRWAFILAATGSAVGLGNIWKFPYITGEYGGGAFVLVYLVSVALIGIPIMMAEVMLGRRGRQSPINTMRSLAKEEGRHGIWSWIGWMGVLAGFLILSYYSVIAGWALAYVFRTGSGAIQAVGSAGIKKIFTELVSDPEKLLAWHTIFMVMTMVVVARGVKNGLEMAVRYLMPALLILLLILVGYAMNTGHFYEAVDFLFKPDFSKLTGGAILTAMGHAFFTLSLGMGAIMIYGSYLPDNASIARTSIIISIADTAVALLAGLAIFPIVFSFPELTPGAGPGLIFQTLPMAFSQMPGGQIFGALFFVLIVIAAWTSSISLIEPAVAWLIENRGMSRVMAAVWCGVATWLVGIATVLSFSKWAFDFNFLGTVKHNGVFDILDILTANIMLPAGGFFIAIFAGWMMSEKHSREELALGRSYILWQFLIKYIAPALVLVVILNLFGVI
ncbi:sodium:neurotransmitter symporter family protein [bacterium BMS3Abin11]|nr:sodium:neurotransmitter symporter family protein [bacterium BMS3Abin11]GMT40446.1 MAG: transporter [bacterium]